MQQTRLPQLIQHQLSQPDIFDMPPRTPHDDTKNTVKMLKSGKSVRLSRTEVMQRIGELFALSSLYITDMVGTILLVPQEE